MPVEPALQRLPLVKQYHGSKLYEAYNIHEFHDFCSYNQTTLESQRMLMGWYLIFVLYGLGLKLESTTPRMTQLEGKQPKWLYNDASDASGQNKFSTF